MGDVYEEVEIEDMSYDPKLQEYTYPCPCGDKFSITLEELYDGEDIGLCPSCTLRIRVIFDEDSLPPLRSPDDEAKEENNIDAVSAILSKDLNINSASASTEELATA